MICRGDSLFEVKSGILTPEIFNSLAEAVGWGHPPADQVQKALDNSLYTVCVLHKNEVIAMGRIIGDSSMSYLIKDVVVKPEFQKKGAGRLIITNMLEFIKTNTPKGWKTCVELMSAHGKEGFYENFGFVKRQGINNGAGMTLILDTDENY